jgi:c(7)-type cytochrome triheme protein
MPMFSNTKTTSSPRNDRPPGGGGRLPDAARAGAVSRWCASVASCLPLALALLLLASGDGRAVDRSELAKVLKTIPPNGPFWKYGNVVMQSRTRGAGVAPVVFAHWSHRSRYTCRVCHQELGFSMRAGDTGITRKQYQAGRYCGACHDGNIAFTVADGPGRQCQKCHLESTKGLERQFADFASDLPLAPFGNGIDWAAALEDGKISPTNVIEASASTLKLPPNLRNPLKLGTTSPRSDVLFSHKDHFVELDCSSCHPDIFNIKKKTTANFTMDSNIYGSFCGACHMLVAFPMNDCRRCHKSMSNSSY